MTPPDAIPDRRVSAIILAAGASSRMRGRDKLLCTVNGMPLLRLAAKAASQSGAFEVIAAVRPAQAARVAALDGLGIRLVEVPSAHRGMAESLKAGVAAASEAAEGAIILLPDMPAITSEHINLLISAFRPGRVVQAVGESGSPGNPVVLPRCLFPSVMELSGDVGAKRVIRSQREDPIAVVLPGNASSLDLDTPEDWQRWHSSSGGGAGGGI